MVSEIPCAILAVGASVGIGAANAVEQQRCERGGHSHLHLDGSGLIKGG
jgi:hypothetical protein